MAPVPVKPNLIDLANQTQPSAVKAKEWPYDAGGVFGRNSFSGADVDVYAILVGYGRSIVSAPVRLFPQTISVSSFREKVPVRALGHTNALGFTRGPRTFAGSMIYTVIHTHPLKTLMSLYAQMNSWGQKDAKGYNVEAIPFSYDESLRKHTQDNRGYPDDLPSIVFLLDFANEMGNRASIVIHGVEFVNDGTTVSIEDPFTENTYQYVARDVFVLTDSSTEEGIVLPSKHNWLGEFQQVTGFDLSDIENFQDLSREELAEIVWAGRTNDYGYTDLSVPTANFSKNYGQETWRGYKPSVGP